VVAQVGGGGHDGRSFRLSCVRHDPVVGHTGTGAVLRR
jgi:hypothetical protein